jgi:hypothetical protein
MGLIRDLISNYAGTRLAEQQEKAKKQIALGEFYKSVFTDPTAKRESKIMAQSAYLDLLNTQAGKKGREAVPSVVSLMSMQHLAGQPQQNTDDPGAPGQGAQPPQPGENLPLSGPRAPQRPGGPPQSKFRPVLSALAGAGRGAENVGRGMLGMAREQPMPQIPESLRGGAWMMTDEEIEQHAEELRQREEARLEREADRIGLTGDAKKRYVLTKTLPATFGAEDKGHWENVEGDDPALQAFDSTADPKKRHRVRIVDGQIVEAYVAGAQAAPARERDEVYAGTDPQMQAWLDEASQAQGGPGMKADPAKAYRITFSEGKPVRAAQAGTVSTAADRTRWSQYFKSAKGMYRQPDGSPISDDQAAQMASNWLMQYDNVHVSAIQQREYMTQELSGVGPGPGMTTNLPAGVVPLGGTTAGQKPAPQPGATSATTTTTPKAEAPPGAAPGTTPTAAAAPAKKLTPRDNNFVMQYLNSVGRVGPPAGGQAGTLGELQGQRFLQNATGLDASTLTVAATEYNANLKALSTAIQTAGGMDRFIREVDNFGKQFLEYGKKITDLGAEWLNLPLREIGPRIMANPALRQYQVAINPLQGAYAAIRSNAAQSRAQLPQRMQEHIDQLLSPNVTLQEATAQVQAIQTEGRLMVQSLAEQQDDIKAKIADNPIGKVLGAQPPKPRDSGVRSKDAKEYRKNHPELFPAR